MEKIAFASSQKLVSKGSMNYFEDYDIYVINADGSNLTRLTTYPDNELAPAWSPDGKKIAFASYGERYGLYVMNADGSNVTRLLKDTIYAPSWSPDGKIVFYRRYEAPGDASEGTEIFFINSDGSNLTKIITFREKAVSNLQWSPDEKIVFSLGPSTSAPAGWNIYVLDVNSKNVTKLTNNPNGDVFPTWSPP